MFSEGPDVHMYAGFLRLVPGEGLELPVEVEYGELDGLSGGVEPHGELGPASERCHATLRL